MTRTILIVDDEPNMRWVLGRAMEQAGYTVRSAESGEDCLAILAHDLIDLVLLDLKLRGEDGLTVLRRIRERGLEVIVIMLTAYGTVTNAVEAMQLGAADFLRKPFDVEEVIFKLARALERRTMQQEIARLTISQRSAPAFETLIGAEPNWQQLVVQAQQVAATNHDVLLLGELGSGRTSIARALHVASAGADAPLIEVDLTIYHDAAQLEAVFGADGAGGAWATAGSGSLVLRGVATATTMQAELAERLAMQKPRAGPRVFLVVAAEQPLVEALESHLPVQLHVPPLRERPGDVLLLAHHFAAGCSLTVLTAQMLEQYPWPGNVTELRGVVERAVRLAGASPIDVVHLPDRVQTFAEQATDSPLLLPPEGVNLEQVEQALIRQALERARGNKSKAAELLGLTRHTLLYRMEKYSISVSE